MTGSATMNGERLDLNSEKYVLFFLYHPGKKTGANVQKAQRFKRYKCTGVTEMG